VQLVYNLDHAGRKTKTKTKTKKQKQASVKFEKLVSEETLVLCQWGVKVR